MYQNRSAETQEMAEVNNKTVDETLAQVVSMGFLLEDAQEAIGLGKLAATDIIEWIINGKPQPARESGSAGTLRLRPPAPVVPDTAPSGDQQTDEPQVTSRMHLNDTQRKIRDSFEEKQRQEAQKRAKLEKLAEKKAKDAVLKQIQEDREKKKMMQSSSNQEVHRVASNEAAAATGQAAGLAKKTSDEALLQIRLPHGRALRETFPAAARLEDVWTFIASKVRGASADSMVLMQPFPRVEYGAADLSTTLADLGLVPSGSLVLQNAPTTAVPATTQPAGGGAAQDSEGAAPMDTDEPAAPPPPPPVNLPAPVLPVAPPAFVVGGGHNWGAGHVLETPEGGENPAPPQEDDEAGAAMDEGEDEDEDQAGGGWGGAVGGGGGFPWGGGGGGGGWGHGHQWGEGAALVGQVLEPANLPHHHQDPRELAAAAARQRYGRQPEPRGGEEAMEAPPPPTQSVPPLRELLIAHVSSRVGDSRHPLVGLQSLPAELATAVLQHLVRQGNLRPRTLHPFVSTRLTRLDLSCYPYATNELLNALRLHTFLTSLNLTSCRLFTDKGLQPLIALKRLKVLTLRGCRQVTNNAISVIKALRTLERLDLGETSVCDAGVSELAASAPPGLTHLNLSHTRVTHASLASLTDGVPGLRSLALEDTQVASLSGIERLTALQTLNLASTAVSTDSLLCLAGMDALRALSINHISNMVGDLALRHIAGLRLQVLMLPSRMTTTDAGMQHLTNMPLVMLDLTNYISVGDEGMRYIGMIQTLKKLRLSNTKVTDVGMLYLEGLSSLEELFVDRTAVTSEGAEVVKAFSRLSELSLSETNVGDDLLISGVLNQLAMLSKLNLSRTQVTDKGLLLLAAPSLSLLSIDHTRVRAGTPALLRSRCPNLRHVTYRRLLTPPASDDED